jgi:hypothetical protein
LLLGDLPIGWMVAYDEVGAGFLLLLSLTPPRAVFGMCHFPDIAMPCGGIRYFFPLVSAG